MIRVLLADDQAVVRAGVRTDPSAPIRRLDLIAAAERALAWVDDAGHLLAEDAPARLVAEILAPNRPARSAVSS
jgi:pimeloyl-ACP methyl ester carboxylesterase